MAASTSQRWQGVLSLDGSFHSLLCLHHYSVAQLCLTLRDPMDCSTTGFPILPSLHYYSHLSLHQTHGCFDTSLLNPPTISIFFFFFLWRTEDFSSKTVGAGRKWQIFHISKEKKMSIFEFYYQVNWSFRNEGEIKTSSEKGRLEESVTQIPHKNNKGSSWNRKKKWQKEMLNI